MKVEVNYESKTGKVHDGGLYAQWIGITSCGLEFSTSPKSEFPWIITNQPVTCKTCRRILDKKKHPYNHSKDDLCIAQVGSNMYIFGIDTKEKAIFATIRSRLTSLQTTWDKMFHGKIDKRQFFSDLKKDLTDVDEDLYNYMLFDGDKKVKPVDAFFEGVGNETTD